MSVEPSSGGGGFPPTAWTLLGDIAAGGSGASAALEAVSRRYWKPVYVFLRRKGRTEADASDATQSFFVHLMEKDLLAQPDRERGRFRSWLRAVLEHFLANRARIDAALKRGGGNRGVSLDTTGGEQALAGGRDLTPEDAFDRTWALEVLDRSLERLDREYAAAAKPGILAALRRRFGLPGSDSDSGPSVDDVTLHRARKRLRALILDEVGDGVSGAGEAEAEVADLFRALVRNS